MSADSPPPHALNVGSNDGTRPASRLFDLTISSFIFNINT